MKTKFTKLNDGWNAEPNAPNPTVSTSKQTLTLKFKVNPWAYQGFAEGDEGEIVFSDCWRYRLGSTNDEGWYRGQCRFSGLAPSWGEFYEVEGDILIDKAPSDWVLLSPGANPARHFLFYFRDNTFECDASNWSLSLLRKQESLLFRLRDPLMNSLKLAGSGQYQEAMQLMDGVIAEAIKEGDELTAGIVIRHAALLNGSERDRSLEKHYYEQFLTACPDSPRILYESADTAMEEGHVDLAKQYAKRCYRAVLSKDNEKIKRDLLDLVLERWPDVSE